MVTKTFYVQNVIVLYIIQIQAVIDARAKD